MIAIKKIVSLVITLLLFSAGVIYLIALDNRYKQIYGQDYFDIWTRRKMPAEVAGSSGVVVEYPLLKSQYEIETGPEL